jgi:hypothetical protein
MQVKRTLLLGALGGAVAVWVAAAATSGTRRGPAIEMPKPQPIDASGTELAAEVSRLRDRLRPDAVPVRSRDLFHYAARGGAARQAPDARNRPTVAAPLPAPVALPPLRLVGLAEDAGASGPIRTAILSGFGDVFLVKAGDAVTARYRVETVTADAVELLDLAEGITIRLQLR